MSEQTREQRSREHAGAERGCSEAREEDEEGAGEEGHRGRASSPGDGDLGTAGAGGAGVAPWAHLTHEDLGSLLEHRRAGHVETLLQPIEPQRLHLLIAALHLEGVVRQLGQLLHVLQGGRGTRDLSGGRQSSQAAPSPAAGTREGQPGVAATRASAGGPGTGGRRSGVRQHSMWGEASPGAA